VRSQTKYIRRSLRKKYPLNPLLVEFLTAWAKYVLNPTPKEEEIFENHLTKLNHSNLLFDLFDYALKKSDYTTLVIACDEVTIDALMSLKTLWDPQLKSAGFEVQQRLNVVFVLAAQDIIWQTANDVAALQRRFCVPPKNRIKLPGPSVQPMVTSDDFTHVVGKVNEMLKDAPQLNKNATDEDLESLRDRLSGANVTWQVLWQQVIDVMVAV
jgi:hypothetical protein